MSYTYKASIIVVNYNGKRYIDNLFKSLKELDTPKEDFQVVFVDNASTDDSLDYIRNNYEEPGFHLKIVESKENLGFAGGNNLGVEHADGAYIVLLNNDTSVDKNWLNPLVREMDAHPEYGIVNSKLLFFYDFLRVDVATVEGVKIARNIIINGVEHCVDAKMTSNVMINGDEPIMKCLDNGVIQVPLIQGVKDYKIEFQVLEKPDEYDYFSVDFDRLPMKMGVNTFEFKKEEIEFLKQTIVQNAGSEINDWYDGYDIGFGQVDGEKYNSPYEIGSGCGASIIMRRDEFIAIGGFDERFFMYYEDTDLSYRMKATGKKLMFCPESIVRHVHTGSSKEWSPFFTYQVVRNKLLFIYKNISKEVYESEYKKILLHAVRSKHDRWIRIRATLDARKLVNGAKGIRF